VVKRAGHKYIILHIIFNFVSKYYFIKYIQLALPNRLKMHGGMPVHPMRSYSWQQTEINGQLKILATLDLVLIRLNIRWVQEVEYT
jgi:hypothetical protein